MWQIYILLCDENFLYVGITNNLDHLTKTTNRFKNIKLIYTENFTNKFDAAIREKEIKGWNHQKKLNLIKLG